MHIIHAHTHAKIYACISIRMVWQASSSSDSSDDEIDRTARIKRAALFVSSSQRRTQHNAAEAALQQSTTAATTAPVTKPSLASPSLVVVGDMLASALGAAKTGKTVKSAQEDAKTGKTVKSAQEDTANMMSPAVTIPATALGNNATEEDAPLRARSQGDDDCRSGSDDVKNRPSGVDMSLGDVVMARMAAGTAASESHANSRNQHVTKAPSEYHGGGGVADPRARVGGVATDGSESDSESESDDDDAQAERRRTDTDRREKSRTRHSDEDVKQEKGMDDSKMKSSANGGNISREGGSNKDQNETSALSSNRVATSWAERMAMEQFARRKKR